MAGEEIDADIAATQRARADRVGVGEVGNFDAELYGGAEKGGEGYATELVDEEDQASDAATVRSAAAGAYRALLASTARPGPHAPAE
jgi:hypothetical protein|eukprot:COSAG02_NODE_6555_length_3499_cov_3.124706_5_plen_87_part_00